jgi:hypothetical protein
MLFCADVFTNRDFIHIYSKPPISPFDIGLNGPGGLNLKISVSEVSSVGLVWEAKDTLKGNVNVAIKTPKNPVTPSDWPGNWYVQGIVSFCTTR